MSMNATPDVRSGRESRLNLRASARQEQLIKAAAAATDKTMTDFVLESATASAEKVLADRRFFILTPEQWSSLDAVLEAPPRKMPRLAALLSEPSPFGVDGR